MTKPNLKLAVQEETPLRNDVRAALAAAQARHAQALAVAQAAKEKLSRADEQLARSQNALETAKAATEKTKARAVAAASGSAREVDVTAMRRVRGHEQDALDGFEISVAARAAIAAKLPDLEAAVTTADHEVGAAVNQVLTAAMANLITEAEGLKSALFAKINVLTFLRHDRDAVFVRGALDEDPGLAVRRMGEIEQRRRPLDQLGDRIDRLRMNLMIPPSKIHDATIDAWAAVRLTLRSNPDAKLPEL